MQQACTDSIRHLQVCLKRHNEKTLGIRVGRTLKQLCRGEWHCFLHFLTHAFCFQSEGARAPVRHIMAASCNLGPAPFLYDKIYCRAATNAHSLQGDCSVTSLKSFTVGPNWKPIQPGRW